LPPVGGDTPFELVDVELEVALLGKEEAGQGPVQVRPGLSEDGWRAFQLGGAAVQGGSRRGPSAGEPLCQLQGS
jgi:hypothetical protein